MYPTGVKNKVPKSLAEDHHLGNCDCWVYIRHTRPTIDVSALVECVVKDTI